MPVDADPYDAVRRRARQGAAALFPFDDPAEYGTRPVGASRMRAARGGLRWEDIAIAPPLFTPRRYEKMLDLGREPYYTDVDLAVDLGGFSSRLPIYASAMGSTEIASRTSLPIARAAGAAGVPLVLGENVTTVRGYATPSSEGHPSLKQRADAYSGTLDEDVGGLVIQQSVEDADAELWNQVYSDPDFEPLLSTGRLGFELKCGQGAKPGLGGLTLVTGDDAERLGKHFLVEETEVGGGLRMRHSAPGTYSEEILRQQIRLMRNNYPRARVWVKLPPTRDMDAAARVAWDAGADAVTVDGAEAGSGLAPTAFLDDVGLPLLECLFLLGRPPADRCLTVSGGFADAGRIVKALALGARSVGLGRALLVALDEGGADGLDRYLQTAAAEMRLLVSAVGKYRVAELTPEDLFLPQGTVPGF